ncbi:hypothetical protein TrVE_jg6229 [Triparma verrucosa]|uniref:Uncharacterized protein n=1 Tax=Triparma verrucosa TaxID=1606542 RepID=A0A9W7C845_9STRA|nr:hypothetical protein TrVE_jg6229 [Triparma verrucosa]
MSGGEVSEDHLAEELAKDDAEEDAEVIGKVKKWQLVPVQDRASDQSNTAPKTLIIPTDSYGCRLGRNPFTGVMDALVSRELLEVTVDVPSPDFPNGRVAFRAMRCPNKITLNLETCFKDDMNKWRAKQGDVVSLYGPKYRYKVVFALDQTSTPTPDVSVQSGGGTQSNGPSATSNSEKNNASSDIERNKSMFTSPFGVKVAPQPEAQISRRISSRKSSVQKAIEKVDENNHGVSALHWGFFVVVSGCMIALVIIFARNSEAAGDEDEGAGQIRLLRGSV